MRRKKFKFRGVVFSVKMADGTVLVTGFGPFGTHKINASWLAVKEMADMGLSYRDGSNIKLEIREIPVVYKRVTDLVPKLWKEVKPMLCVHVGVSPYECVKIERVARNNGYYAADIDGSVPSNCRCVEGGCEEHNTKVKVLKVVDKVKMTLQDVTVSYSNDAGRYLCDFIYYTSLHHGDAPVIFVHVPPLDDPYSSTQLAIALKHIIEAIMNDWEDCVE